MLTRKWPYETQYNTILFVVKFLKKKTGVFQLYVGFHDYQERQRAQGLCQDVELQS